MLLETLNESKQNCRLSDAHQKWAVQFLWMILGTGLAAFTLLFIPVVGFPGLMQVQAAESLVPGTTNDDSLFDSYVDEVFYGDLEGGVSIQSSDTARAETLSEADRYVYDIVYQAVCEIADGERSSSIITFSNAPLEQMTGRQASADDDLFSLANVIYALLDDCPYELYWYDKTGTTRADSSDGSCTIRMPVIADYSPSRVLGTYVVDRSVTGAATIAASNARSIASNAYEYGIYEALDYYRGEICDLTDYNYDAPGTTYGNPWEMIWVFDNDPSTKVVCEGYSKAFKYLCDLWKVQHPTSEMECYLVEGVLGSNGAHMWNIVRMNNGKNYLADITNCDTGTNKRRFFLMGSSDVVTTEFQSETRTLGYTVEGKDGTSLQYRYQRPYNSSSGTVRMVYLSLTMYAEDEISINADNYNADDPGDIFTDVRDSSAWYYAPVYWAVENEITDGATESSFGVGRTCTRGEAVTFLYRAAGSPEVSGSNPFTDLTRDWYKDAVQWAYENDITSGISETEFGPDEDCTRAQIVTFLYKAAGSPEVSGSNPFTDLTRDWYQDAVQWAYANEITSGKSSSGFGPDDPCMREQIVTFLYKAWQKDLLD